MFFFCSFVCLFFKFFFFCYKHLSKTLIEIMCVLYFAGGIFGLFESGRLDHVLNTSTTNSIHDWFQLTENVPWLP